jgi:hypothetical protein
MRDELPAPEATCTTPFVKSDALGPLDLHDVLLALFTLEAGLLLIVVEP